MDYIEDDRPSYEYHHELDGLRKQNDQLREMVHQLRNEINGYRAKAEEATIKMRQMEEARAGVTGTRLFFQRSDGAENVSLFHYTVDGTRSLCRARIDTGKYTMIELAETPDGLCDRCASSLELEFRYNPYAVSDGFSTDSRTRKTIEQSNETFFKLKPDANPLFTTYVYLIQSEGETHFKVGISTNPRSRVAGLRHAAGRVLKVLMISEACTPDGARSVEYAVKSEFDNRRVAQEWYHLNWNQVKRVKEIITMTVAKDRNQKHKLSRA